MTTILGAAASGIEHYARMMDAIGHNLSNVNTDGFKVVRAAAQGDPNVLVEGVNRRMGVAETALDRQFHVGSARPTSEPLNFAIQDDALFAVRDSAGALAFSRQGALAVDSAGNVVVPGGHLLEPSIQLEEGMLSPAITDGGIITAFNGAGERVEVGRIPVYKFMNPQGLESIGNGLYVQTVNSGEVLAGFPGEGDFAPLLTGAVESSNVDMSTEFANMVVAQRAYQASARSFSIGDQMLEVATNITR
jgi:flagellar basal-body rod protein FlgG